MLNIPNWKKTNITNIVFSFLSVSIVPVAIFIPVGLWIPLVISALILFFNEKNKAIYLKISSNLELLLLLFILYAGLSLIWTINFSYAKEFFFHLLVLFLSFKVLIAHSSQTTNLNKIKVLLYYSFNLSSLIAICDMYFYIGTKSILTYLFELAFTQKSIWSFSFAELNNYRLQVEDGMFSGVYNRGLSVALIFGFILCNIFYNKKLHLAILLLIFSTLILVGESFSVQIIFFLSLFILFFLKFFKSFFSLFFAIIISFYFIFSPVLLNLTNEEKWSNDYYFTSNEIRELHESKVTDSSVVNYNDLRYIAKNSYLIFKSKILHRTMIWSYTSEKIKENIFFGKGLFSSRKLGETDTIKLLDRTLNDKIIVYPSIPLHPHNNVLQIWLELGLIGISIFLSIHLLIWFFLYKKLKLHNIRDILIVLPFFSVLIINQISYGVFQTWWLAAVGYLTLYINILLKTRPSW